MGVGKASSKFTTSKCECNRPKKVIYKIDNIIKENGHHVVRLPPYHCDLNAIEYVWSSVKRLIRERNVTGDLSLENLKNLTQKALDEVTSQEWQAHCNHVEKLENYYWDKDELLEEIVDGLIIQTGSSDSDSDSEETESCDSDSDDFSDFIPL
ncbi:protein FAM243A-like [Stegodyphus dumicola]|uniref:protein FAM243A-like n=1 Tax=Stegodyphus dumicola TaxID=202533 RepID=UPI0015AE7987|nr:protein FAM243A-like [Stegodyphus dumicola]